MNFNNFTFCNQVTFQNVALTNGFGHIFVLSSILLHHHVWLWSMFVTWCSFLHIFQILFQHFHFNIAWYHFREGNKMITILLRHDVLKSACGPKMSLCVMYFAPSLGSFFCSFSDCSKYITFSITFGPHVPQTTSLRNVFRASPFPSVQPPGRPSAHLSRHDRPRIPGHHRTARNDFGKVPPKCTKQATRPHHDVL